MKNSKLKIVVNRQQILERKIKNICSFWWVNLSIDNIKLIENIKENISIIEYDLNFSRKKNKKIHIIGKGKGLVDSFFNSLKNELSFKYPSLNGIIFKEFNIVPIVSQKKYNKHKTDIFAKCELIVTNSRNEEFYFSAKGFSLVFVTVSVIIKAIELFVNAHDAILNMSFCLKDAKDRKREDLVVQYTNNMIELVKITDYSDYLKNKGECNDR